MIIQCGQRPRASENDAGAIECKGVVKLIEPCPIEDPKCGKRLGRRSLLFGDFGTETNHSFQLHAAALSVRDAFHRFKCDVKGM